MRLTPRLNPRLIALAAAVVMFSTAAALPLSVQGVTEGPWGVWRTEVVDDIADIFGYTVLQLDSKGNPHILYTRWLDGEPASLWYAAHDGLIWHRERVASRSIGGWMVLDEKDEPHISHRVGLGDFQQARYTTRADGFWVSEVVDERIRVSQSRMLLDSAGVPHILFGAWDQSLKLNYAVRTSTGWVTTILDHSKWAGSNFDFALDARNRLHAAYVIDDSTQPDPLLTFRYMQKDGDNPWTREVVPGCQMQLSLTTDSLSRPHIACRLPTGLSYVYHDGVAWQQETAATQGANPRIYKPSAPYVGFDPSIRLDTQDRPHLSYWVTYNIGNPNDPFWPGQLHYGVKINGQWSHEVVDHDGQHNGKGSNIFLDEQDRPHISYLFTWRWTPPDYLGPLNARTQIRYAEPVVATILGPAGL